MSKKIYFDLDGTLYGLYKMPNWLDRLENEVAGIFTDGAWELGKQEKEDFLFCVYELIKNSYEFGVISWLPMRASPEYLEICRKEKLAWIQENIPFVNEINLIPYGTPKQNAVQKRAKEMWLIDDNVEICKAWETAKQRKCILVNDNFNAADALSQIIDG